MTEKETAWHAISDQAVIKKLKTNKNKGLAPEEVSSRLLSLGYNELPEKKRTPLIIRFLSQFNDFMTWVLIAAVLVSIFALRETLDAVVIALIVVANAVLSFIQEGRAERAIGALRNLTAPTAFAIRNGSEDKVMARELVPGDIVILEAGARIPADARLIETANLLVNEAILTGESMPANKHIQAIDKNVSILDRNNMVYMGTTIAAGRGKACVVATGPASEMGKIAELVQKPQDKTTPLQQELHDVGKRIAIICLIIAIFVFGLGVLRGNPWQLMFLAGVSLAVAAIPEGLPAVVTITLALGLERMAKKNAIVRRLSAVETLGAATVICTDKTGTLTRNEMRIGVIFVGNDRFKLEDGRLSDDLDARLTRLLIIGALVNDSRKGAEDVYIGDPTEIALLVGAEANRISKQQLNMLFPRVAEIPFDSDRKMMTTVHELRSQEAIRSGDEDESGMVDKYPLVAYTKGAPELVLDKCTHVFTGDKVVALTGAKKKAILKKNMELAEEAFRMLAFAYRPLGMPVPGTDYTTLDSGDTERDMIFVGLAGLIDPPRPEVYTAIRECKDALIQVAMVTGDHRTTAEAIGRELDLLTEGKQVMSSDTLKTLSDRELKKMAGDIAIYARVSAEDKIRIIDALRARGNIIAMTGDGVNDAPAIRRADIGVSMGRVGADVTREASDLVLTDDNFATIVTAIREGRVIFDNLKKFIYFLLSCNISEVLIMLLVMLVSRHPPLWPVQLLWINLVTDGLPALALGVDIAEPGIMKRAPREPTEKILSLGNQLNLLWQGLLMTAGAISAYVLALYVLGRDLDGARTVLFATLVFVQLFHTFNSRSESKSALSMGLFSNKYLLGALIISAALQLAVIYVPVLQPFFRTESLFLKDWGVVFVCAFIPVLLIESVKQMKVGWNEKAV